MSAWQALRTTSGPCALFESTTSEGPVAQRTLLARRPHTWLVADHSTVRIHDGSGERRIQAEPLALVRALLQQSSAGRWPDEPAAVGALAYDWARPARAEPGAPLLVAMLVERLEVFPAEAPAPASRDDAPGVPLELERWSNLARADYCRRVRRVQEHIAAGDVYQVNLAQRFDVPLASDGLALYEQLRVLSPAPFSGYLRVPGLELVSASPERLVSVQDDRVTTRPIAGTRPRSPDPRHDAALAQELILSPKERAEHLMLVDLARNDLGRVARIGSVEVDELMSVEDYAHVRHIVSNVRARLAPGRDALDALQAVFPGGTITGVPKRRCLALLDDLEPVPRGFYTGAFFYLTRSGRLDASILIRTATVSQGRARFHAGAGIVADSDPEAEYEETLHKAQGLRLALERLGAGARAPRAVPDPA